MTIEEFIKEKKVDCKKYPNEFVDVSELATALKIIERYREAFKKAETTYCNAKMTDESCLESRREIGKIIEETLYNLNIEDL